MNAVQEAIREVVAGRGLGERAAYETANAIMEGRATECQIAGLLVGMRMKGETVEEITGFVRAMRERVGRVPIDGDLVMDTCGMGGDGAGTFNISTVAAFVAAGAGCKVAKHGNRAVSSRCGSAEVLEALGVEIERSPERTAMDIESCGMGFLFAPMYHRATQCAVVPRREIGVRSIFNIVGPLTHPAGAKRQVVGVFDEKLTEIAARVLLNVGSVHCMVVHGMDGMDEISLSGATRVSELKDGCVRTTTITPKTMGLGAIDIGAIKGGDARENARIALAILNGEKGERRDIVLANAGAAIYVAGRAGSLREGVVMAGESIDSGRAMGVLEKLKRRNV